VVPEYYYAVGPVYNVTSPFTVNLYLNTTIIDNRDTSGAINASLYIFSLTNGSH
jgi:thermopsin